MYIYIAIYGPAVGGSLCCEVEVGCFYLYIYIYICLSVYLSIRLYISISTYMYFILCDILYICCHLVGCRWLYIY